MAEGGPCRCGRGTLYDVLQVSAWCEHAVIQVAYRAFARTRHPDVNRGRDAEDQVRRHNVAYQTLSDPVQRARYDEELVLVAARIVTARPAGPPNDGPHVAARTKASQGIRSSRRHIASAPASAQPYQAMIFDQRRSEGLLSPQQQRPRSQLEPSRTSGDAPGTWLFEGADADARPGLSPLGDRWNR